MKRFITMKWVFAGTFAVLTVLSIVTWCIQPAAAPPGKKPLVWVTDTNPLRTEQVSLFNRSHAQTDLELDPNDSGVEKVIVQSIGGVGPDVFDAFDGSQLAAFVKSGVALDVTDALKARGVDIASSAFPAVLNAAMLDGRVYGVPTNIAADATWFHRDIFDEAHIPYPKGPIKWDEVIRIAQKLTVRDANGRITRFGILLPWWNWRHFFAGFGAHVFSPDGTRCVVDSPEAIAAVELMHDLVYKYHVCPSPAEEAGIASQGGFGASDSGVFGAKRAAMAVGGRWWLSELRKIPDLHLGVFESPFQNVRHFRAYGRATLVSRETKNLDAALDFLVFLAGKSYNQLVNDQADGSSAFPAYDTGPQFLHNPKHPEEDYNEVWQTASRYSVPDDLCPFVDSTTSTRLFQNQLDLIQNNLKTPAQAMRDAAANINAEIQHAIADDPSLAARYRAATGSK